MTDVVASARAGELAARWTRWVARTSYSDSPLRDATGKDAGRKQPSDVWFLGGTMGGEARREFAVPAGQPLFGPAFCMWSGGELELSDIERSWGEVRVDGQDLLVVWAETGRTWIRGTRDNPVTRSPWPAARYMVGAWAMIDPLPAGTHTVEIEGGDGYGFRVAVHATIHVP